MNVLPLINVAQTSSTNSSNAYTITPQAGIRVIIYSIYAFTSAGTSTISITDGGTTVFQGESGGITTTPWWMDQTTPRVFSIGGAVVVTITAAGVGNTSTLNLQAGLLHLEATGTGVK